MLLLAACGSGAEVKLAHGVIQIPSSTQVSSLRRSVVGITVGTNAASLQTKLGAPFAKVRTPSDVCWAYRAEQPGTSIDALDFCIDAGQRVDRILIGVHS